MSKGPGRIQRAIAALIAADADGAWSYADICRADGREPTRAALSAVGRAAKRMTLPGTWMVGRCGYGDLQRWLYDRCNLMSARKAYPGCREHAFQPGGYVFKQVEAAIRYRDASPSEKIGLEIADLQMYMGLVGTALQNGGDQKACAEDLKRITARIDALKAERAKLAAG
jgi:hypothetical protein